MAIGDFVKERREKAGMTQQELADQVGTTKQVINLLEHGITRVPSEKIMDGLANTFKVTKSKIISYVYPK